MKKIISLILAVASLLSLAACASTEENKITTSIDNNKFDDNDNRVVIYSGAEEYRNEYRTDRA